MEAKSCLLTLAVAFGSLMAKDLHAKRPNIVLFLVDDMGWQDTSVPFDTVLSKWNKMYRTPNMERMAARSVKFTQAYASAVSSPSRVSLMTGMSPASHRVTNWTLNKDVSQDTKSDRLTFPAWNVNGLQPTGEKINNSINANTLPEILRQNGYTTIHCGKAHFGARNTRGENPLNLGFDVNIAGHAAGGLASYLGEKNFGNVPGDSVQPRFAVPGLEKYWGKDIFITEALTIEALSALDSVRRGKPGKPFFLYMSHYAIHTPFNADKRFYQSYRDEGLDHSQAMYASMIEGMDKSLGDVMSYLERNKLSDNTIVIFMSDNGGLSACGRTGEKDRHNSPLRSGKGSVLEGGIRVPMIVLDPTIVQNTDIVSIPVAISDFMPTILEMAGVSKYKTIQHIDGQSFCSLIGGRKGSAPYTRDTFVWHYPNRWDCTGDGTGSYSAIRKGDYKYIYFYDTGQSELYNVALDQGESRNLVSKVGYEELAHRMAAFLEAYLQTHNAQLPIDKSTGRQCHYPSITAVNVQ